MFIQAFSQNCVRLTESRRGLGSHAIQFKGKSFKHTAFTSSILANTYTQKHPVCLKSKWEKPSDTKIREIISMDTLDYTKYFSLNPKEMSRNDLHFPNAFWVPIDQMMWIYCL